MSIQETNLYFTLWIFCVTKRPLGMIEEWGTNCLISSLILFRPDQDWSCSELIKFDPDQSWSSLVLFRADQVWSCSGLIKFDPVQAWSSLILFRADQVWSCFLCTVRSTLWGGGSAWSLIPLWGGDSGWFLLM